MKVALGISVIVNVVLAAVLVLRSPSPSRPATSTLCERLPGDLDFFVDGLKKGNDPFYSPLAVRLLEPAMLQCAPEHGDDVRAAMPMLRSALLSLVASNVGDDVKRRAHDQALAIFVDLRALLPAAKAP